MEKTDNKELSFTKKMQNCQIVALTFMLTSKLFSQSPEEQLLRIEEHQRELSASSATKPKESRKKDVGKNYLSKSLICRV